MGVLPSLKHLSWYYVELTFVDRLEKGMRHEKRLLWVKQNANTSCLYNFGLILKGDYNLQGS